MKSYEAVFILDERKLEDGESAFIEAVTAQIQSLGGSVKAKKSLGRRPFARMIKKQKAGTYWDFVFDLSPDQVYTFKDKYRLNSAVLRLVVFNYEEPPAQPQVTDNQAAY